MGSLYQRKQRDGSKGGPWWAKYRNADGELVRVSTEIENKAQARNWLAIREGKAASGETVPTGRLQWEELREMLLTYYRSTERRDVDEAMTRIRHLDRYFAGYRVDRITSDAIAKYITTRQAEGAANGTINREVATIMRALKLAVEFKRLGAVPIVHKPKEAAPRAGFFEVETFKAIQAKLALDLQMATDIAYDLGWRTQSEVLPLELRQVDLDEGSIILDPGSIKNGDGRAVYLTTELVAKFRAHVERVRELGRQRGQVIPWLFPIFANPHTPTRLVGTQRKDFRKAWRTASRAAGYPDAIRHDFRRTAVRGMVNAGVPERVAMQVTGHRTRAVFDRYHIVSSNDLKAAAAKLAASREVLGTTAGTTGTISELRPVPRLAQTGT